MSESKQTPERKMYFQPNHRFRVATTVYEAELADLLSRQMVRQLVVLQTPHGWMLHVLPSWKHEFMTLVSMKKEVRHYQSLDRLIATVTKHGDLPPVLLLGEPP